MLNDEDVKSIVYVDVTVEFSKDGILRTISFRWGDDHVYQIERVKKIRRAVSLKVGGVWM